jgi:hypothetical protein
MQYAVSKVHKSRNRRIEMATLNDTLNSKTGPDVVSAPAMRQMPAEDARRIAACWNACQHIPTEALEAGVVGELVEACRTLVDSSLPAWPGRSAIEIAHKALAKAKGGE